MCAKRIAVMRNDGSEHHSKVILDDGDHGPGWAIMNTIPLFEQELVKRFNLKGVQKFKYFSCCVTGQAATHRSNLLETEFIQTNCSNNDFDMALICYIEEVAEHRFLQDSLLVFLAKWKNYFVMEFKNYIYHCNMLYKYAISKYTRGSMQIPGKIEKKECFFYATTRPHQEVFTDHYADRNSVTMAEMTTIFDGYFCTDKMNGKYNTLLHAHKKKIDSQKACGLKQSKDSAHGNYNCGPPCDRQTKDSSRENAGNKSYRRDNDRDD